MRHVLLAVAACLAVGSFTTHARGQGLEYVKAHYAKREHWIPMRDGARLFTAVYSPRDASQTYPILMIRTQSGVLPYGEDQYPTDLGPSPHFGKSRYIFVYQDIRGRWMSDGTFVNLRPHIANKTSSQDVDESTDTYDTIEWLLKNIPNHNGRVGHYGTSYRGFLAAAGMIDAHPALKAVAPQAPVVDYFVGDDWHHNGAFFLTHTFFYAPIVGKRRLAPYNVAPPRPDYGTPDAYDFFLRLGPLPNVDAIHFKGEVPFWNAMMQHGAYDDFWKSRNITHHLKNIKPAVLIVGGWFDAEDLWGTLEAYHRIETASPGTTSTLVMGPWIHSGWNSKSNAGSALGAVSFGSPTCEFYRAEVEFPFFEFHLKDKGPFEPPEALVFETGTNRWRQHASWPPRETSPFELYFHERGRLAAAPPGDAEEETSFDEFVSDPAKPVPYFDGIAFRMAPEFMAGDQRFAASRPDVLVYETEVLTEPVTLAGPMVADLHVSTTGTDSDWVVKLIDVYPNAFPDPDPNPAGMHLGGYQQLVRGEVMRGKFRDSLEEPRPFTPREPTEVRFTLPDVYHTFRVGHKIMVQVQCSWFPLVDRNPQSFVDIYSADASDFRKATQRVFRSKQMPSRVVARRLANADSPREVTP